MLHQPSWPSLFMIYVLFALSSHILEAEGAKHIVGDGNGWGRFRYSTNWTQGREFHVGDVLVFNYKRDTHTVMQVNSTAYANCIKDQYMMLFTKDNDSIILSKVGELWYICGVADHCENGQKLSINVIP